MVVAPTSTIDPDCPSGNKVVMESRTEDEIFMFNENRGAAEGSGARNPVIDVTPAELIDAIVTEKGVIDEPESSD